MKKALIIGGGIISALLIAAIFIVIAIFSNVAETVSNVIDNVKNNGNVTQAVNSVKEQANNALSQVMGDPAQDSCEIFNQRLDQFAQQQTNSENPSYLDNVITDKINLIKTGVENTPESARGIACQKGVQAIDALSK